MREGRPVVNHVALVVVLPTYPCAAESASGEPLRGIVDYRRSLTGVGDMNGVVRSRWSGGGLYGRLLVLLEKDLR